MPQSSPSPVVREAAPQGSRPAPPLRVAAPRPYGPAAVVTRRAADHLREGHLWVYRSDVAELVPAPGSEAIAPGTLLTIVDSRAIPLGTALYSDASEIALRLISPEAAHTRPAYLAELRVRVAAAIALRRQLAPEAFVPQSATDALRLIFSEADELPGIVVDRYNELVIVQLLTQGTAQNDVRAALVETLQTELNQSGLTLIERPDPRIRELEHLPPAPSQPCWEPRTHPSPPSSSSTVFASTSTPPPARRPEPFSTSASTTRPPPATPMAPRSTSAPTRAASRCTWPRSARPLQASIPAALLSRWPTRTSS